MKLKSVHINPSEKIIDKVNHPSHYNEGKIECIDAIESATTGLDGFDAFIIGNTIKYLWRFKSKNGFEDLKKAEWYLKKLIEKYARIEVMPYENN